MSVVLQLVVLFGVVVVVWRVGRREFFRRTMGDGVEFRRSIAIHAYVGGNGGGKTLAMVHDTLPTLAGIRWNCANRTHAHTQAGVTSGVRRVLSTVELFDGDGSLHPLYDRLTSWRQLVTAEHCDVLLDEVAGAASSRSSQSMPPQMVQKFGQFRKARVAVRYTTPNWSRTDVCLREVTRGVTHCKGMMGEDGVVDEHDDDPAAGAGEPWTQNRLFRWATYDAVAWDALSMQALRKARAVRVAWYWRPGKAAAGAYCSEDSVEVLDHVSEAGLCMMCGGSRTRPRCTCDGPKHSSSARELRPPVTKVDTVLEEARAAFLAREGVSGPG